MKQRKIDVIVKYFHPVVAGIETNVLETYTVLAKNGWKVIIHTSSDTYTGRGVLPGEESLRGLQIKRYEYRNGYFQPEIDWGAADLVCLHNFDLVLFLRILLFCSWRKFLGKKTFSLVLTPHGGYTPSWETFPLPQRVLKWLYHKTLAVVMVNFVVDAVRAVSFWEKEEMVKFGISKRKIQVISNGLENEAFATLGGKVKPAMKRKIEKLGRFILQIGRIYEVKNYETTIRALPLIPKDIKFVIVGPVRDPKYRTKLEKLAELLGVEKRVIFWGVIRSFDKFFLIKKSVMMVHLALYESFGNAIHEGISQGKICIVANNTAMPLLVKNGVNGFLVPTRDHKQLAQKINFVLDKANKKEVLAIEKNNRKLAKGQSWKNVALKMDKLYRSL